MQLDLTTHSSILATVSVGEGSTKAGMSMEEVHEEVAATADIPPPHELSTLSQVSDVAIENPSKRSHGTEHTERRTPDAIVPEHSASGPSRSWDRSAVVEGEESAKAALCLEREKDGPHDDITNTDVLPPQSIIDVVIEGVSRTHSRSSLDKGKYPSLPHSQYDIV